MKFLIIYTIFAFLTFFISIFFMEHIINKQLLAAGYNDKCHKWDSDNIFISLCCGILWIVAPLFWIGMLLNIRLCESYGGYMYLRPEDAEDIDINIDEDHYIC